MFFHHLHPKKVLEGNNFPAYSYILDKAVILLLGFILEKANSLVNSCRSIKIAKINYFSWSETQKIKNSPVVLVHTYRFIHITDCREAVKLWLKSQGKRGDFYYSISKLTALYSLSYV